MNWIKNLFGKKEGEQCVTSDVDHDHSPLYKHEQLLIKKVIKLLKCKPDFFSARWFTGRSLEYSVRSQYKSILIMIKTGEIIQPIQPEMTEQQKKAVKQLVAPIVVKDSEYLIENLINEPQQ